MGCLSVLIGFIFFLTIGTASTCHGEHVRLGLAIIFVVAVPFFLSFLADIKKTPEQLDKEYEEAKKLEPYMKIAALLIAPRSYNKVRARRGPGAGLLGAADNCNLDS